MKRIRYRGVTHEVPDERYELEILIRQGVTLTRGIGLLAAKLEGIKDRVRPLLAEEMLERGSQSAKALGVAGYAEATIQRSFEISAQDVAKVRELLGDCYGEMVQESVGRKPTAKMRELLADGDSELVQALRPLVKIKTSKPRVRFVERLGSE